MARAGLTGILLVGGASSRFGAPKALATLDGETLAERAWRTLGAAGDDRIAVGKRDDELDLPFPILDDGTEVRAALAGIVAGLRAASTELAVVLPVDMPFVRPSDLRLLAADTPEVSVPQTGPLPCAVRRSALAVLETCLREGRLALRETFAALAGRTVELDPGALVNVNTPAELAALQVEIVPLRPEHGEGFRSLVSDTLSEFGFTPDAALDPDLPDPAGYYAAVWVALAGGGVVGSIALRELRKDTLELKRMYLLPTWRGRGVGRRLLDTALAWARSRPVRTIVLDTTEEMEVARRLYERYGFVRAPGEAPRQGQRRLLYELRI